MPRLQTRHSDFFTEFVSLDASLETNAGELEHLEVPRQALRALVTEIRSLSSEQDLHRANSQQLTRRLQAAMNEGKKLVTFLRTGLKQHYGNRNEKLVEFGIQPFRGRRKPTSPPPPAESTAPADPAPAVD